jgi:hypothetical protein
MRRRSVRKTDSFLALTKDLSGLIAVIAPWIAGQLSAAAGTARSAFDPGIALLALACAGYAAFVRIAGRLVHG